MRSNQVKIFAVLTAFFMVLSTVIPFAGTASANEVISVEDAIVNNEGTATVEGYIVAHTSGTVSFDFDAPFGNDYNVALADSPNETDPEKLLPVQVPSSFRGDFGLQTNPNIIGEKIQVTGNLEPYFTVPGLKNSTEMIFTDREPEPEPDPVVAPAIHEIQGESHHSPLNGQQVKEVEGIVTFVESSSQFYIQSLAPDDNPKTSEGLMVYKSNHGLKAGDVIKVDGEVKEYVLAGYYERFETDLTFTEIAANSVTKTSEKELPEPVVVGEDVTYPTSVIDNDQFQQFDPKEDGIDFYESLEGMLIALESPYIVGPQKYGEVPVIPELLEGKDYTDKGGVLLQEHNSNPERIFIEAGEDFVAKTGDRFTNQVSGVLSYSYSNFKLLTNEATLPKLEESSVERNATILEETGDKLSVASYNIENFSSQTSPEKVEKIAQSIINQLKTPDIIGLVEVQDNDGEADTGTTDASQSYQVLIDKIKDLGGPTYEFTDIAPEDKKDGGAPGGNIRVGYIYQPDRVTLKEAPKGTATEAVSYENGALTFNPGRIDPQNPIFEDTRKALTAQFVFNGEDIILINNHFNSKGGDAPLFGKIQPPVLESEEKRIDIVTVINGFIRDVKSKNPDANVIVMGDLNDFQYSKPLEVLKGDLLTNAVDTLPVNERYTYNYQGNAQVLDHILVSNNLAPNMEADIVNINSDYMEIHGRASDHDPVLVQFDLNPEDKPLDLTLMHTNDTHAHLENAPHMHTAIQSVRAENPNALLLNAGDVFSGTLFFNKYLGQADLEFMNKIGYDAMTFGNHEFDKDSKTLADFIEGAEFPFVSANVNVSEDQVLNPLTVNEIGSPGEKGKIYPAIVKEVEGKKVGIIGLTTEDTSFLANPSDQIVFEDAKVKTEETIASLEEQGVNHIIVLSHLGFTADQELANSVSGIDIIVGGHSHTKLDEPIVANADAEPTLIVQANEYAKFLGKLQASFNEEGVVTEWNGNLIDILAKNEAGEFIYPQDEWAANRLAQLNKPIEEMKKTVIGHTNVPLNGERSDVRTKETNLGNLITDAMLEKANKSVPTQIAMQNGGGIRASIDEGEITLGELLTVMPFGNTLVTLDLTGEEILQALEHSVSLVEEQAGQFMQVSGLKFHFDPSQPGGERVFEVQVQTENGFEDIKLDQMYTVATNAFVADGGDGYSMFKQAKDEGRMNELFFVDYEVTQEYLEMNSPVSPQVEDRILEGEKPDEEQPEEDKCERPHPGKQKGHDKQDDHKKGKGKKKGHKPCKDKDKDKKHHKSA
ncbi:2',3'-cyclic-nucleotide 2'-phosphodiesterase (5'-nucleotidase family)/predicted extracellular nuclease [Bacillus pakistanensis]|uniref:2',3'-cyclic-nucleotide 2'-phosphodiesterase (5'-nucleotidase family)/predicted extracellular nuclease n=1 Tax=Rossellomorea pakistanensis TaxID=992288 RepID=A0ABS2NAK5_9BACI|nr:5'-nucleotidase C-terminal domain-containing protein [Bacillus pakistanensis]MBM7584878.1 2',3'-cyclic-nucleotide 2'-phosphodiesterase (5'-nucleotidase family)/predicted extracellular nuclease [Bacillus pakistanensis]